MIVVKVLCKQTKILLSCLVVLCFSMAFYPSSQVMACDCYVPETAHEALEKADAVFKGKVLQLKKERIKGETYNVALFSVSETWKGINETQVTVFTDWTSCHFNFEVGKEYLLYPNKLKGELNVIDCGRSAETQFAANDLLELGKGGEPKNIVQLEDEFQNDLIITLFGLALPIIVTVSIIVALRKWRKQ
ncbi:hypothetical protein IM538_13000 [Cytobacillus suaedae]|nr:hypothetical protein IM538_13000 [Cytobacillus suaedae]